MARPGFSVILALLMLVTAGTALYSRSHTHHMKEQMPSTFFQDAVAAGQAKDIPMEKFDDMSFENPVVR
jgi:hypothetical protein